MSCKPVTSFPGCSVPSPRSQCAGMLASRPGIPAISCPAAAHPPPSWSPCAGMTSPCGREAGLLFPPVYSGIWTGRSRAAPGCQPRESAAVGTGGWEAAFLWADLHPAGLAWDPCFGDSSGAPGRPSSALGVLSHCPAVRPLSHRDSPVLNSGSFVGPSWGSLAFDPLCLWPPSRSLAS